MTAVNLTKLNSEIFDLLAYFTRPADFHAGLSNLFGYYGVQVFHSGKVVRSDVRIKKYHLPILVLMQFERLIRKRCLENPQAALRLYDELISDPFAEVCNLAASILGCVPSSHAVEVLNRINQQGMAWERDDRLLDFLQRSTDGMICQTPQMWSDFLEETLAIACDNYHRFGLLLLQVSLQNECFVNIPFFFRHFLLFFPKANLRFRQEYLKIFEELYQRYPTESIHFFEQSLLTIDNEAIFRMFRKFLPTLAEPERSRLRVLAQG